MGPCKKGLFFIPVLLGVLFLLLIHIPAKSQYHLEGNISLSPGWQKKLYISKMRDYKNNFDLVDSIVIGQEGNFNYVFKKDDDNSIFRILIPKTDGREKDGLDGYEQNYLFVIPEKKGSCKIISKAGSLYFSAKYLNSALNKKLLYFQELERPYSVLSSALKDSLIKHPEDQYAIKSRFMKQWMIIKDSMIVQIKHFISNETNEPLAMVGLYNLYMAEQGEIDDLFVEHVLEKFKSSNKKKVLVSKVNEPKLATFVIPDIPLYDTSGNLFHLSDKMKEYQILDFWASWCSPCRKANVREVPFFISTLDTSKVQFISISIDSDLKAWKAAVKKDNVTWSTFVENNEHTLQKKILNASGVPQYFLIKDNKVISKNIDIYSLGILLKQLTK